MIHSIFFRISFDKSCLFSFVGENVKRLKILRVTIAQSVDLVQKREMQFPNYVFADADMVLQFIKSFSAKP